jgi:tripartite-type tricarboxylate transporter receptor subunit TctC
MKATFPTLLLAGALAMAAAAPARAQGAADYYRGKTITVFVGLSPGGGYDQNARLVARFLSKHVPGNPSVVVRNMPGAGGLVMTNYVANVAAPDGLNIGAPQRGVPFQPLFEKDPKAQFDPRKLQWIGSVNADTSVAIVSSRTGVNDWKDLEKKEVIVAGTGVGTESVVVPYVLRNLLGLKLKVIAGFPGGSEMNLAMERGEVDGRGTFSWTSLKPHYKEMIESGKYKILFQMGLRKHKDLPEVPLALDLSSDPDVKRLLKLEFTAFELGRPMFVGPQVPKHLTEILRKAFDETMKDPELLAEAQRTDLEVEPMTGQEMQDAFNEIYDTPPALLKRLAEASAEKPDLQILDRPKKGDATE